MDDSQKPDDGSSLATVLFTQKVEHPRLKHGAAVAIGFVFLILIIVVAAVGLWRQAQAERRPRRQSNGSKRRVDLMEAVMPEEQTDQSRRPPKSGGAHGENSQR